MNECLLEIWDYMNDWRTGKKKSFETIALITLRVSPYEEKVREYYESQED